MEGIRMAQNYDSGNGSNQELNQQAQNKVGGDVNTQNSVGTGGLTGSSADLGAQNTQGPGGGMPNDSDYESSQQYGQQNYTEREQGLQETYGNQTGNTGKSPGGPNSNAGAGRTNSGPGDNFGGGYQQATGDMQEQTGAGSTFKTGGNNNSGTPSQGKE
jgi:hypothetical protein